MIEIKDVGSYDSIPELANYVIDENINMLDKELSKGLDLDEEIKFSKYASLSPLSLALIMNKAKSVKWLVDNGADLNDEDNLSFLLAVRYCDEPLIRYLISQGAKTDVLNRVDSDAFEQALYGGKIENLALIDELGHSVKKIWRSSLQKSGK